jgi:isopentenyl diphosphate isomerase/L-lactate dehydrogenase-like FMN-dependent dehydrogenase
VTAAGHGRERQRDIYLSGLRGKKPLVPQNATALERAAERAMSAEGFAYIAGGAGLETTMKSNREAFERVRIVPRMLRGSALALGARAVLICRPYCYGLAIAGEAGVREVIQNFLADLDLTLALTGCKSLSDVAPEMLVTSRAPA